MSASTATIRPAQLADAAAVLALTIELGYSNDLMEMQQRLTQLQALPEHSILVADDAGRVVALMHAHVGHQIESRSCVEIAALIVHESHRSRGIGAQLIAAAEAFARERGVRELRVRSHVRRTRSHAFYKRLGFEETKEQKCFARKLADPVRPE